MSKPLNHAILQAEVHQLIEKYNNVQSVVLEQIKDDKAKLVQNYSTGPEETVSAGEVAKFYNGYKSYES